jgi:hypothetical protein
VGIVGSVGEGIAQQLPDIGHFIKTVSNGLYSLGTKEKSLKGVQLLEPSRIRAISGDLARHLRAYHAVQVSSPDDRVAIAKAKKACLQSIDSIVPHHCGNHVFCVGSNCLFVRLEAHVRCKAYAEGRDISEEEVASEALNEHAVSGRFKGKMMSLSVVGQEKVSAVLTSRVGPKNVDRIARIMSSNRCEKNFSTLIKHSEGKRLYLGQSDSFRVLLYFAAGVQNNKAMTTNMLESVGGSTSVIREQALQKLSHVKKGNRDRKNTVEHTTRRIAGKQIKLARHALDHRSSERHKPDKLHPGDDCRVVSARAATNMQALRSSNPSESTLATSDGVRKRKPSKCSNCRMEGHTIKACIEPIIKKVSRKEKSTMKSTSQSICSVKDLSLEDFLEE